MYDHWCRVFKFLNDASILNSRDTEKVAELLPSVHRNALDMTGNDTTSNTYKMYIDSAVEVVRPIQNKMNEYDRDGREHTLRIMRACRFFNYEFVSKTNIDELRDEIHQLKNIAYFNDDNVFDDLLDELRRYKEEANRAVTNAPDGVDDGDSEDGYLWAFWKLNSERLPSFFAAACEVAIIQPSSATVERYYHYYYYYYY